MSAYPTEWACDVVLSDGATVHVRPLRPDDRAQLEALYDRSSRRTRYMRFFSAPKRLPESLLDRLVNVDYVDRMALVAVLGDTVIAVGRYDRLPDKPVAEVAFIVDDDNQGRGLGTLLLEHLATIASRYGIERFMALTLPENDEMLGVFRSAGFTVTRAPFADSRPAVELSFPITTTDQSTRAREERDRKAIIRSVEPILAPRSVAVVGASARPGSVGRHLIDRLVAANYRGTIHPVNPHRQTVAGRPCTPDVTTIDGPVDLALIAVPAAAVEAVVAQCGEKGVRGLVIYSAGFADAGDEGRRLQQSAVELAHRLGMRVIGPNSVGVFTTDPAVCLDALLSARDFEGLGETGGNVALMSQSGAVGLIALEEAAARGLGISSFVSVGNKADISGNDLLQYWESDPRTSVIVLYLESFGNPRNFARIARRVSMSKPILAVKGGRARAGARPGPSSMTGPAHAEVAVDELFRQAGVTRTDTLEELCDTAVGFSSAPLPHGRSVAIVGNAGGPGVLTADACESSALVVTGLGAATSDSLGKLLPSRTIGNPVDLGAAASATVYEQAVAALLDDAAVDSVIVTHVSLGAVGAGDVATAIGAVLAERAIRGVDTKPVLLAALGAASIDAKDRDPRIAQYRFPESAAKVLGHLADRRDWLFRSHAPAPPCDGFDHGAARALVDSALRDQPDGGWLGLAEAMALLATTGVRCAVVAKADDSDHAVAIAGAIGYPVALKAGSPALTHKTDRGGIHLNLHNDFDVTCAHLDMEHRLGSELGGVVVQPMVEAGVEMLVAVANDRHFGPLILVGAGGVNAELFADQAARIVPLAEHDAADMIESLRVSKLLHGFRANPRVDVDALRDVIERVAQLTDAFPEIEELRVNPVIVGAHGATAVDAKIRVAPAPLHLDDEMRRLRG